MAHESPILLFDGVCNLCNGFVNFLLDREREARLRFAAMQSPAGQALLGRHGLPLADYRSMVLIDAAGLHQKSAAALRLLAGLRPPWSWLRVLAVVPAPLRDTVYDLIARHRYRLFGRRRECRVATPALRARFLQEAPAQCR